MLKSSVEHLRNTLTEWATLYHKKFQPDELEIWIRLFKDTPMPVLVRALEDVTKNSERFPSVGTLTHAITAARDKMGWQDGPKLTARAGEDAKGVPCVFWSDEPNVPAYKAADCPEGRAFLALLAEFREKKPIP